MAVDESTFAEQGDDDLIPGDDPDAHARREAVREAADGRLASQRQVDDATEWFLSDEPLQSSKTLQLNVGTSEVPRWINWVITSVDTDVLKRIRREGQNRAQRRRGETEIDPAEANARIVVEGTLSPDLAEVARRKELPETADPSWGQVQVLKHRFREKPGLIDQLAGEILTISGYDEDDIREAEAAKNS